MSRDLLSMAQVAAKLGHSDVEWFRDRRAELVADHGFPPPVPGCGNFWDPVAIERWFDLQMPAHLRDGAAAGSPIVALGAANDGGAGEGEIEKQRAVLRQRATQGA